MKPITIQTQARPREFLDPQKLLREVPVEPGMKIADSGCGNGYYAAAAAALTSVKGEVYALDILEEALSQTATLARLVHKRNIQTRQCDLEKYGSCPLDDVSCDLVIVGSILHEVSDKKNLLREAYRVLKSGGKLLVVDWHPDSPFGPPASERLKKDMVRQLLEEHHFRPVSELPAGAFHYALLYAK